MEGIIIVVVLLYFLFICLDFAVPEIVFSSHNSIFTDEYQEFIQGWTLMFWIVDLVFLTIFIVEITVRVYAWGLSYLRDVLNFVDAVVVFVSFAMLFATMDLTIYGGAGQSNANGADSARAILRVFRIVRIFRIVIILNKIKRSRENAQILRKKAKYKRQGSPVERVLEILQRLRRKAESAADRDNLSFITDAIISDQLYTVSVSSSTEGLSNEMSAFLLEGGAQTKSSARVGVGKVLGITKGGSTKAPKGKRAQVKGPNDPPEAAAQQQQQQDGDGPDHAPPAPTGGGDGNGNGGGGPAADRRGGRRGSVLQASELLWLERLQQDDKVKGCLAKFTSWDFNVFELERVSSGHPVVLIALHAISTFELEASLPIKMDNLVRFLLRVESGYNNVPFHNYVHAADVTHGTAYFLSQENVARHLTPLDIYCLILGAAMHDFNHPGFNNAFLVASRHETAILYNDVSVLENFHIANSWRLMLEDDLNPFANFTEEQYQEARQTMVYAILGTDMKFHFDHLTKFKTRLSAGAFEDPERKDVRLLLAMCLHSADVSNPAKKWEYTTEWAARVMEEFFQQGEKEASLGLPVSPFMDRKKTDIGQCQAGFISILIKPFFDEWTQFLGDSCRHIFTNVEDNIKRWQEEGEGALGDRAKQLHDGPIRPSRAQ